MATRRGPRCDRRARRDAVPCRLHRANDRGPQSHSHCHGVREQRGACGDSVPTRSPTSVIGSTAGQAFRANSQPGRLHVPLVTSCEVVPFEPPFDLHHRGTSPSSQPPGNFLAVAEQLSLPSTGTRIPAGKEGVGSPGSTPPHRPQRASQNDGYCYRCDCYDPLRADTLGGRESTAAYSPTCGQ